MTRKLLKEADQLGALFAAGMVLGVGMMVGYHHFAEQTLDEKDPRVSNLPACVEEDSRNCIWNATTEGNGEGVTFVDIEGTAYYLDN
jgi:hypothetical protein